MGIMYYPIPITLTITTNPLTLNLTRTLTLKPSLNSQTGVCSWEHQPECVFWYSAVTLTIKVIATIILLLRRINNRKPWKIINKHSGVFLMLVSNSNTNNLCNKPNYICHFYNICVHLHTHVNNAFLNCTYFSFAPFFFLKSIYCCQRQLEREKHIPPYPC